MGKQSDPSGFQLWKIILFFSPVFLMLAGGGYWFANYQADKKLLASEVRIQKMLVEMKQRTNENAELQSELKKTKSHLEAFEESFNELKNVFFQEQEVRIQREQTINLLESKCSK